MALFGGSKKNENKYITNTTTTTEMRDVGLTGQHAVDMAAVLQSGANESEAIRAQSLDKLVQQTGANYQQLIGGANNLIVNSTDQNKAFLENARKQGENSSNLLNNFITESGNTVRRLADKAVGDESDTIKMAPYIGVVIMAAFGVYMAARK